MTMPYTPPADHGPALPWHWDTASKVLWATLLAGEAGDWMTTVDAARRGGYAEMNPLLGAHPSVGHVNAAVAGATVANTVLPSLLSQKWRRRYLAGMAALEAANALRNHAIGLHFSTRF